MRIHKIEARTVVDGPGERTAVFLQGCTISCTGCQNRHLWTTDGGNEINVADLADTLLLMGKPVTITGGEPFQQPAALAELVFRLRYDAPEIHIIVYTGYTWEELMQSSHPAYPWMKTIMEMVDVIVDGRFVRSLDDPFIAYRGSRNQRPIDVQASLGNDQVVTLDWDNELIIAGNGDLLMPAGYAGMFSEIGNITRTRMCGQTKENL